MKWTESFPLFPAFNRSSLMYISCSISQALNTGKNASSDWGEIIFRRSTKNEST